MAFTIGRSLEISQRTPSQPVSPARQPRWELGIQRGWRHCKSKNIQPAVIRAVDVHRCRRDQGDARFLPIGNLPSHDLEKVWHPCCHQGAHEIKIAIFTILGQPRRKLQHLVAKLPPGDLVPFASFQLALSQARSEQEQLLTHLEQCMAHRQMPPQNFRTFRRILGVALGLWQRMKTRPSVFQMPTQHMANGRNVWELGSPPFQWGRVHFWGQRNLSR